MKSIFLREFNFQDLTPRIRPQGSGFDLDNQVIPGHNVLGCERAIEEEALAMLTPQEVLSRLVRIAVVLGLLLLSIVGGCGDSGTDVDT